MPFTYEETTLTTPLETMEWDNVWWEQTYDTEAKRLLYIGDSISCATRHQVTARSGGQWLCDGFGTSKAVDNPHLHDAIRLFHAQEGTLSAVLVNNGLHGWHLTDEDDYAAGLDALLTFVKTEFDRVPIYVVLTTAVANEERHRRVKARNRQALALAKQHGLPVIDLYAVAADNMALLSSDGTHFTGEGYEKLAKTILDTLNKR